MASGLIDLRSDTVTRPTPEMRRAMAAAEVGDDVCGEDPTVNALEEAFAARVGKAAALFVPSGTMGNQLALRLLASPGTTVVAGPADLIVEARGERQRLGGGMRQAGIIAAAGLIALDRMVDRLADDHARARRLAEAVADRWPDSGCDPVGIRANVVTWRHDDAVALVERLAAEGVLVGTIAPSVVRLVTHHDVDDRGVDRAVSALRGVA